MGKARKLIDTMSLSQSWPDHIKVTDFKNFKMATKEVVHFDTIIIMYLRTVNLCVCALFVVIEKFGSDVLLGTSFIDCHNLGVFLGELKVVTWNTFPVFILLS